MSWILYGCDGTHFALYLLCCFYNWLKAIWDESVASASPVRVTSLDLTAATIIALSTLGLPITAHGLTWMSLRSFPVSSSFLRSLTDHMRSNDGYQFGV